MSNGNDKERLAIVDQICEDFEAEWIAGRCPEIAGYLTGTSVSAEELLEYLLPIDMEYRGKTSDCSESLYVTMLAAHEATVRRVYRERTGRGEPATKEQLDRIGDYRLIRLIGQGGMGDVYEAEHDSLNRRVALKLMPRSVEQDAESVARFRRETRTAASLHHTNIVPVFEVGRHDGHNFYAMQLIEGMDLKQWLTENKPSADPESFRRAARIGAQVARALAFAHDREIVHRDIKPANLLLDADENVWITDFGLAKRTDDGLTRTGAVVGTLRYLSPERLSGTCDAKADIYALGATLFEMVAGVAPFPATDRSELISQIARETPAPLSRQVASVPLDLETIIHKAIQRDPGDRYDSAHAMADDLERFLTDRPVLARRMSLLERASRFVRRNKVLTTGASLILMLLVSSILLLAWGLSSARTHERVQRELTRDSIENQYYAEMALAGTIADSPTGIERLRELVTHWNAEQNPDHRGWEWRHFNALTHSEELILPVDRILLGVDWSPTGDRLATIAEGYLGIWNTKTGSELGTQEISATTVSFGPRGERVATGTRDGAVTVWDATASRALAQWSCDDDGGIASVCWHPTSNLIVVQTKLGRLYRWEPGTENTVLITDQSPDSHACRFEFNPDGTRLAAVGRPRPDEAVYAVTIWNTQTWEPTAVLGGSVWPLGGISWNPDGTRLTACSYDGTARVWDVETGVASEPFSAGSQPLASVDWQPNGPLIATAGYDRQVCVWRSNNDDPDIPLSFAFRGHSESVSAVCWSPDGTRIASSGLDGTVRIWDTGRPAVHQLRGRPHEVGHLIWGAEDRRLASIGDGHIIWDAGTWAREASGPAANHWSNDFTTRAVADLTELRILHGDESVASHRIGMISYPCQRIDWTPDGKRIAYAGLGEHQDLTRVLVCDLDSPKHRDEGPEVTGFGCVEWDPSGRLLAVGAHVLDGSFQFGVTIYDAEQRSVVRDLPLNIRAIKSLAWSPDGRKLAVGGDEADILILDATTGATEQVLRGHTFTVRTLAWHPTAPRLASGSIDETVKIWNVATGRLATSFQQESGVVAVAWSRDGTRLASKTANGQITIRDSVPGRFGLR